VETNFNLLPESAMIILTIAIVELATDHSTFFFSIPISSPWSSLYQCIIYRTLTLSPSCRFRFILHKAYAITKKKNPHLTVPFSHGLCLKIPSLLWLAVHLFLLGIVGPRTEYINRNQTTS